MVLAPILIYFYAQNLFPDIPQISRRLAFCSKNTVSCITGHSFISVYQIIKVIKKPIIENRAIGGRAGIG